MVTDNTQIIYIPRIQNIQLLNGSLILEASIDKRYKKVLASSYPLPKASNVASCVPFQKYSSNHISKYTVFCASCFLCTNGNTVLNFAFILLILSEMLICFPFTYVSIYPSIHPFIY